VTAAPDGLGRDRRPGPVCQNVVVRLPSARTFLFTTALSIPVVAALMWTFRRHELSSGLPCEARGTQGCSYDANLAAGYGAVVGVGALCLVAVTAGLLKRWPGPASVISALLFAGWLLVAAILIRGTQS